jgi:hypothetical protein
MSYFLEAIRKRKVLGKGRIINNILSIDERCFLEQYWLQRPQEVSFHFLTLLESKSYVSLLFQKQ